MPRHAILACAMALACFATPALADGQARCVDAAIAKASITQRGGKWIALTSDEFQFLRGIYVLNPQTPPGLPYGDRAVLVRAEGNPGGMIYWIDGDKACTPMPVPREIVEMMTAVATGEISHEGSGL